MPKHRFPKRDFRTQISNPFNLSNSPFSIYYLNFNFFFLLLQFPSHGRALPKHTHLNLIPSLLHASVCAHFKTHIPHLLFKFFKQITRHDTTQRLFLMVEIQKRVLFTVWDPSLTGCHSHPPFVFWFFFNSSLTVVSPFFSLGLRYFLLHARGIVKCLCRWSHTVFDSDTH